MTEKTKPNKETEDVIKKNRKEIPFENNSDEPEKNLRECTTESRYYYDDSYGYEVYNPDEDDEED